MVVVSYERGFPVALPHSGWPTVLKLTCGVCGVKSVNFGAERNPGTTKLVRPYGLDTELEPASSHFKNEHLAELRSGSEEGSYLRLID